MQKLVKAVLPDLFECKICGGNNCEHLEKDPDDVIAELSPMLTMTARPFEVQRMDDIASQINGNKSDVNGPNTVVWLEIHENTLILSK